MGRAVVVAGVGAAIGAAIYAATRTPDGDDGAADFWQKIAASVRGGIMDLSSGFDFIRVSNMGRVQPSLLDNSNVRAMLRVIRQGESGQTDMAYRMIVGGGLFQDFADHPRIAGKCWATSVGKRLCSTAAGAYQFTATSWDETKRLMKLPDFSPASQDMGAVGRIAYRGALPDVVAGRLSDAIKKLRLEWTSLPGAAENNKLAGGLEDAKRIFLAYGGTITGGVLA